jgi:hypothetical protein
MKKLLTLLFILLSSNAYALGCYGWQPYEPIGYCDGGSWELVCTNGDWVWICVNGNSSGLWY